MLKNKNNMKHNNLLNEIETTPEQIERIKNDNRLITALSFMIVFCFIVYVVMSVVDVVNLV
jgi:hypothetical protein